MNAKPSFIRVTRRNFLQTSLLGSTALAATAIMPDAARAELTKAPGDPWHGLKVGMTSYSLRALPLDEVLSVARQAGIQYIALKDMHLPLKSTPQQCAEVAAKVKQAGLHLAGGGVIYMKDNEAEIRHVFEYAQAAGMPTIICSPDPEALDTVEKMAREFKIRVAIHNHGPTDTKYPSPLDVLKLIKERDPLMGICMDVGHTVRIKEDPIPVIHECSSRLYDFHIKDETAAEKNGKPTELGRGVIDLVAVLKALLDIKFSYQVALEYEANEKTPVTGVMECYAYLRGVLAAI